MPEDTILVPCDICGIQRQMGPHVYELRRLPLYDVVVCREHIEAHHDGWAPQFKEKLLAKLRDKPEPKRLPSGLLPVGL